MQTEETDELPSVEVLQAVDAMMPDTTDVQTSAPAEEPEKLEEDVQIDESALTAPVAEAHIAAPAEGMTIQEVVG